MNEMVAFTRMDQGTFEEYQLLDRLYRAHTAKLADEVLAMLARLGGDPLGYRVSRLDHSLQTATRAQRAGADEELVALLHDIGDTLAPFNHADLAAAILKPFVSPENRWVVEKHAVFQGYHYWHHYGLDRNGRERRQRSGRCPGLRMLQRRIPHRCASDGCWICDLDHVPNPDARDGGGCPYAAPLHPSHSWADAMRKSRR